MLHVKAKPQSPPSYSHLYRLMSPAGITQFGHGLDADASSGTCLDDNVRAWLAAICGLAVNPGEAGLRLVGDVAADFVAAAQRPDGRFRNMADIGGRFLEAVGSDDSFGRTMWIAGVAARCAPVERWRRIAVDAIAGALPVARTIRSVNARSYIILGLAAAMAPEVVSQVAPLDDPIEPALRKRLERLLDDLCAELTSEFRSAAGPGWDWWSNAVTWGNGRMPQALLCGSMILQNIGVERVGIRALDFLDANTRRDGIFVPIGNQGWFVRGARPAIYDQQPIEAAAMVDAWLAAYRVTGDAGCLSSAYRTYDWFHGANTEGLPMAIPECGACRDGLMRGRVNWNAGAESTLSYVQATLSLYNVERAGTRSVIETR